MRKRLIQSLIAAAALIFCSDVTAAANLGAGSGETLTVVLLPAHAYATAAGQFFTPAAARGWSAATQKGLDSGLRRAVDESSRLRSVALPALAPKEVAAIAEFMTVATRAVAHASRRGESGSTNQSLVGGELTFGPSLTFLHDRTGTDYALGFIGARLQPGVDVFASLSVDPSRAFGIHADTLGVSFTYAALVLVHLQTGQVVWMNDHNGYQAAGLKSMNLHETQSVRDMAATLLETLPDIPPTPAVIGTSIGGPSTRATAPVQGGFAVKMPEGWEVSSDGYAVTATGDGSSLNVMQVELRDHRRAFPATGQQSTRTSTPEQLAQWYLTDLQRRELNGLTIIEKTNIAQIAGVPAFRLRFSYRLPVSQGGVHVEQTTIGAAVPHGFLLSQLSALQLNYFKKSLPSFEISTGTIVLKPRRHLH